MSSHILVVDDDELVRTGLAEDLQREGYRVTTAASGTEALEALSRFSFDLVLTDLVMERPDGMDLLRHITAQTPDLPVIILTGHGTTANAIEAIREGAADYILKPARPEEIAHRIRTVLDAREMRRKLLRERARAQGQRRTSDVREARHARMEAIRRFAAGLARDLSAALARLHERVAQPAEPTPPPWTELITLMERLQRIGLDDPPSLRAVPLAEWLSAHIASEAFQALLRSYPLLRLDFHTPSEPMRAACSDALLTALGQLLEALVRSRIGARRIAVSLDTERMARADGQSALFVALVLRIDVPMTAEQAERIWEPYFAETELRWDGIGALTFTEACLSVLQCGGYGDARSVENGRAVELVFFVPAADQTADTIAIAHHRARPGERILILDDNETHAQEARRMLEELGYETLLFHTGAAAIAWLQERVRRGYPTADLALVDLVLGEAWDGVEVFKRMRQIHPRQKGILIGGFVETERVQQAYDEGIAAYVRKPFTIETLSRVVREALDNG